MSSLKGGAGGGGGRGGKKKASWDTGDETSSSRGLKSLTSHVMRVIEELKTSTYSDIASAVVEATKQEGNKRRRVYDVLNVLVAMGILKKNGKTIQWMGEPSPSTNTESNGVSTKNGAPSPNIQTSIIEADVTSLGEAVSSKKQELASLLVQHLLLHELARTNAQHQEQQEGDQDQRRVNLPFVVLSTAPETPVDIQLAEDKTSAVVTFQGPFEVHDDLEVLTRMNLLDNLTAETLRSIVPEELWSLLPSAISEKFARSAGPESGNANKRVRTEASS